LTVIHAAYSEELPEPLLLPSASLDKEATLILPFQVPKIFLTIPLFFGKKGPKAVVIFNIPLTMQDRIRPEKIYDFPLLENKVYEIKRNIIDLSFHGNHQPVEQRLAEEIGVSKSPVREALLELEREGSI